MLFPLILLISAIDDCFSQTTTAIDYINYKECINDTYYDVSQMKCSKCPNGTVPSADKFSCVCPQGQILTAIGCHQCPDGTSMSEDGLFCVECLNTTKKMNRIEKCPNCASGEITAFSLAANMQFMQQICQKCPENSRPSFDKRICIPCSKADLLSCSCQKENCSENSFPSETLYSIQYEDRSFSPNLYIKKNLRKSQKRCLSGVSTSCQNLANLCVLQNYRTQPPSACNVFEELFSKNSIEHRNNKLPAILYHNTESNIELNRENAINAKFYLLKTMPNSEVNILSVAFDINGTFLELIPLQKSRIFPSCFDDFVIRFGVRYSFNCRVSLDKLTDLSDIIFYDLYFQFIDVNNKTKLFPVPIVNENIRKDNEFFNRLSANDMSKWTLSRRIYSFDRTFKKTPDNQLKPVIRYLAMLSIEIQVQSRKDGYLMPPYIRIRHNEFDEDHPNPASIQFSVNYIKNEESYERDLEIIMAIIGTISIVISASATYSWGRRSGKIVVDFSTVLKLILFECDVLSEIFFAVVTIMAISATFIYKAQSLLYFTMPNPPQERTFIAYLIAATTLRFISLLHTNLHLTIVKTFFIDWERPQLIDINKEQQGSPKLSKNERKEEPPVIWRTYLVANEWNELQCCRKTSVSLQLVTILVLLRWFKLENWSAVAPGFSTDVSSSYCQSVISRYAVVAFLYLTIALIQWLLNTLILERLVLDRFRNFIDLCSIANISVISLTEPLHGYYIHGRSIHGSADANMAQINLYLQKERDNLCGERGLEQNSELQTFVINVPKSFKAYFDQITSELCQARMNCRETKGFEATTIKIDEISRAHSKMNHFLMEFVEHNNPSVDYVIRDSTFFEAIFNIEFNDTTTTGIFARDKSEIAFTKAFFYGNEWIYLSFEMLLFCCIDLAFNDFTIAAFIIYIISKSIKYIFSIIFTNNLVNSSFVDQRFLF